jgi:hypothetical protein
MPEQQQYFPKIISDEENMRSPNHWHIVKRGLDWTGKTRTGLRLVNRGLDSISKTRTGPQFRAKI